MKQSYFNSQIENSHYRTKTILLHHENQTIKQEIYAIVPGIIYRKNKIVYKK